MLGLVRRVVWRRRGVDNRCVCGRRVRAGSRRRWAVGRHVDYQVGLQVGTDTDRQLALLQVHGLHVSEQGVAGSRGAHLVNGGLVRDLSGPCRTVECSRS